MICRKSYPFVENIAKKNKAGGSTLREISVESLKAGDTLASSIHCSFSYRLLLPRGTVITDEHLRRLGSLKAQGHCLILESSDMEGIRLELLDRVDEQVKRAYLDTYVVGKSIFENLQRGIPINLTLTAKQNKKRPQPLQIKGSRPSNFIRNM
jgi:hypothetical protein